MAAEPAQNEHPLSSGQVATPNGGIPTGVRELREGMNRLRGRLFGAVEATGMPARQEEAVKRLIRQASYDVQADVESALREVK